VRTKAALIQDRPKNGIFAVCRAVFIAIRSAHQHGFGVALVALGSPIKGRVN